MEKFQKYFVFRPVFTIIFRLEMLKFHQYSILTRETMVGFVIYCVLRLCENLPADFYTFAPLKASPSAFLRVKVVDF